MVPPVARNWVSQNQIISQVAEWHIIENQTLYQWNPSKAWTLDFRAFFAWNAKCRIFQNECGLIHPEVLAEQSSVVRSSFHLLKECCTCARTPFTFRRTPCTRITSLLPWAEGATAQTRLTLTTHSLGLRKDTTCNVFKRCWNRSLLWLISCFRRFSSKTQGPLSSFVTQYFSQLNKQIPDL